MGYAFDSTSNFNATWSNSYATAVLAPGNAVAAGFARAADKRYFEFVVDANADVGYLWLGVLWRLGTSQNGWLIGGGSEVGTTAGGVIGGKSAGLTSVTAEAGDVFGFAVNYSTDGIGGLSSVTYAGAGVIEISKNGVFTGHRAVFPASGPYVAGARPLIIQEAGTSTSAVVTLRVDSLSYSYMPAGYSEWGASGGVSVVGTATYTFGYVLTNLGTGFSLSASTSAYRAAYWPVSLETWISNPTARTKNMPQHAKSVFEVVLQSTLSYSEQFSMHLVKEGLNAGVLTAPSSTQSGLFEMPSYGSSWTGVKVEGSTSNTTVFAPAAWGNAEANTDKVFGYVYDPTKGFRFYGVSGWASYASSDVESAAWAISVTSSTTMIGALGWNFGFVATDTNNKNKKFYINDGSLRRMSVPLFPGWRSMNQRWYNQGGGAQWNLGTSTTANDVVANEVAVSAYAALGKAKVITATPKRSSGKYYFEVLTNTGAPGLGVHFGVGVADDSFSFSTNPAGGIIHSFYGNFVTNPAVLSVVRDGTTISSNMTLTAVTEGMTWHACVAVDFAAGKVWLGRKQLTAANSSRSIKWFGGDPSTGLDPQMTFTASKTFAPAILAYGASANAAFGGIAAFEDGALAHDPPSGFTAWAGSNSLQNTTTATVTPSFTGSSTSTSTASSTSTNAPGGGSGGRKWPFGFRP